MKKFNIPYVPKCVDNLKTIKETLAKQTRKSMICIEHIHAYLYNLIL